MQVGVAHIGIHDGNGAHALAAILDEDGCEERFPHAALISVYEKDAHRSAEDGRSTARNFFRTVSAETIFGTSLFFSDFFPENFPDIVLTVFFFVAPAM